MSVLTLILNYKKNMETNAHKLIFSLVQEQNRYFQTYMQRLKMAIRGKPNISVKIATLKLEITY